MNYLLRFFIYFWYVGTPAYRLWSAVYAWLWERRYADEQLPVFVSFHYLQKHLQSLRYRPDSIQELGDATSSLGALAWRAKYKKAEFGDCDDHARYGATILQRVLELKDSRFWAGSNLQDVQAVHMLSFFWSNPLGGHALVVMRVGGGLYRYLDYGMLSEPMDIDTLVSALVARYGGETVLGWVLLNPETLKPVVAGIEGFPRLP